MQWSRPKWQQELSNYILDNIFDFLTIGAAAYVVIRNQFKPYGTNDITELVTWVLGILGILAVSSLWERHRKLRNIEDISIQTHEIVARKFRGEVWAEDFFWKDEKKITAQDFSKADDIFIVGMTLNRTIRDHLASFGDRVDSGANLKFILLDCDNEALMKVLPLRSYGTRSSKWWQSRIQQTIGHIEDIPNTEKPKGS